MTEQTQALAIYGDDKQIEEVKRRLISMYFPGGKKLQEAEARALAQISLTYGLNPMNGELWLLPTGPMVGIKGLRRKAREQLNHGHDGNFWTNFVALDPKDYSRLKIPDGSLAFECRLFDTETITTYVSTIKQLKEAGMPWEAISQIVGAQPYTSGYGYHKPGEATKMTPVQVAMKRAEADAIKRRFDIEFGGGILVEGDEGTIDPETVSGEWKVANPPAASAEQRKADNAVLFGEDDFDKPTPAPTAENTDDQAHMEYEAEKDNYDNACAVMDSNGEPYGRKTTEQLTKIVNAQSAPAEKKSAAKLIIEWRADHLQAA
jgi:hypothetical protein